VSWIGKGTELDLKKEAKKQSSKVTKKQQTFEACSFASLNLCNFASLIIWWLSVIFLSLNFLLTQSAFADSGVPFAVVELFTSEGCSSCPPADALLRKLTTEAREENKRIFTLGFHVDYWDYLGWRDRFSRPEYTERQNRYADVLRSDSVYTPQMIINGTEAFVGSNKTLAYQNIEKALQKPVAVQLDLRLQQNSPAEIELSYSCSEIPPNAVLNVALVENGLSNQVVNGENRGQLLSHANVVRSFTTIQPQKEGNITLKKPSELNSTNSSVIAYLQDAYDMSILVAKSLSLNSLSTP
jgi:hypothetical protein